MYRVGVHCTAHLFGNKFYLSKTFRAWRLERKEVRMLRKQAEIGNKYNVIKNVSTHSMLNDLDGELSIIIVFIARFLIDSLIT